VPETERVGLLIEPMVNHREEKEEEKKKKRKKKRKKKKKKKKSTKTSPNLHQVPKTKSPNRAHGES
ncbi:UNVERIFIED_CONTAM: hypothetical protein K2H54_072263, partial [Gekko kuhli]